MQFVVLPWQDKLGTNFRKTIEKDDGVSHLQRWSGPIPAAEEEPDWMKLSVAGAEKSFLSGAILYYILDICQDRLGTNIGRTLKEGVSAGPTPAGAAIFW